MACIILLAHSRLFCEEEFIYDAKDLRNPFVPLVTPDGRLLQLEKTQKKSELSLEGIIYDEQRLSYALINGLVVKVGDFIGDYQILKIQKDRVILIRDGQTQEIGLKKEE